MKIGVNLSINVSKIDKDLLFTGKNGKYLDATVFVNLDELSQFGDNGIINQSISKESKDAGETGALLGNAKVFWRNDGNEVLKQDNAPQVKTGGNFDDSDSIPF